MCADGMVSLRHPSRMSWRVPTLVLGHAKLLVESARDFRPQLLVAYGARTNTTLPSERVRNCTAGEYLASLECVQLAF